MNTVNLTLSLH